MIEIPASPYLDQPNQGYYLSGTRISLDSVAHAVNRSQTIDEILADFPLLQSRVHLEGAIALIKAHPKAINAYLAAAAQASEEARRLNPPDFVSAARSYRLARDSKTA